MPGLSSDEDDEDNDDTSGGAEQLNEPAKAGEETAGRRRPWREQRMKSLLSSIKKRIAGDRVDDRLPRAENAHLGDVTLDVLQHLLPHLSMRPVSSVDSSNSPILSHTLKRQMCLRKKKADCGLLGKDRSKTAPCGMEGFPDMSSFDQSFPEIPVKSASSTPNLIYPEDVNEVPTVFRSRSQNVTMKAYRRANSAQ